MKNLYFTLVALLAASGAFAQLQSGTKFAGLHAGGSITKTDVFNKTTTYIVSPTLGYFLSDNVMIGLQGEYGKSVSASSRQMPAYGSGYYGYTTTVGEVSTRAYSVGIMSRYYLPVGSKVAFFIESVGGYAAAKVKVKNQSAHVKYEPDPNGQTAGSPWGVPTDYYQASLTTENKEVFLYGGLTPGITYFPKPKLGLELKANMISYLYSYDRGGQVDASFNLSKASIGAGFYF
jgi:hypothetical protein